MAFFVQSAFILCPSCVSVKSVPDSNYDSLVRKTKEINANKPAIGIKPRIQGHKLRNVVNWEGALEQKGIKETGTKQGPVGEMCCCCPLLHRIIQLSNDASCNVISLYY